MKVVAVKKILNYLDEINDSVWVTDDVRLAKNLLFRAISGYLFFKNNSHGEEKIQLKTYNWIDGSSDRNWWWQIQQLYIFDWCRLCWPQLNEDEKKIAYRFCYDSLKNWHTIASNNQSSPLVWHDHVSCLRLKNISNWFSLLLVDSLTNEIFMYEEEQLVKNIINSHIDFLILQKNYKRYTNHGLDQMLAVYIVSLTLGELIISKNAGEIALERLHNEIDFAFTSQGVHKENSPWYHMHMIWRVEGLSRLNLIGDKKIYLKSLENKKKGHDFLCAITLPNGNLPLIGDTYGGGSIANIKHLPQFEVLDYADSGYVIVRGVSEKKKPFHMIFKNGHLSNYHRHDDDLSIHLYYNDEVLFGDAGLYSYNEKDPKRIFVRSAYGHNCVFPKNYRCERDRSKVIKKTSLRIVDENIIEGQSYSFGLGVRRRVDFSRLWKGEIIITDSYVDHALKNPPLIVNFFFPFAAKVFGDYKEKNISSINSEIFIKSNMSGNNIERKKDQCNTIVSSSHMEYEQATSLTMGYDITEKSYIKHNIYIF